MYNGHLDMPSTDLVLTNKINRFHSQSQCLVSRDVFLVYLLQVLRDLIRASTYSYRIVANVSPTGVCEIKLRTVGVNSFNYKRHSKRSHTSILGVLLRHV